MRVYSGSQESKVLFLFGQCPMPNAQCPARANAQCPARANAQCPRTPHVTEKGSISRE